MADLPATAFVSGGAVRVGRALVEALAARGFAVAIHCHRSRDAAEALAADLEALGGRATVVVGNLALPEMPAALIGEAVSALGPLGVLVNNAATFVDDRLASLDHGRWQHQLAVNLTAPALLAKAFAAQLPADRSGVIVNISDQRVANPTCNYLGYSVSKAGLEMLTAVLARDLAPRIRVNNLVLGQVLPASGISPERHAALVAGTPLRRATGLAEIGHALGLILASPSMTGAGIRLDSGMALGWAMPWRPASVG